MKTSKKPIDFADLISVMQKPNQNSNQNSNIYSNYSSKGGLNIFESKNKFLEVKNRVVTPTKIHERIQNSPLKGPLQKVIQKAVRDRSAMNVSPSKSRILGKSSRKDDVSGMSMKKVYYDQEPEERQLKAHTETYNFIKKYFDFSSPQIPIDIFIDRVIQEYQGLWGNQNAEQIIQDFTYKFQEIFGVERVQIRELVKITKTDGMIGLILEIFKGIRNQQVTRMSSYQSFSQNPNILSMNKSFESRLNNDEGINNIKNIIQQFMETMYLCMETQIYNKFNIQMRRMVLKYKDAERLVKKINEKLTFHADFFEIEKKLREQEKNYEAKIDDLKKIKEKLQYNIEKNTEQINSFKVEKQKMEDEIHKLKENLNKYQNAIFNKAMENIPIMNADPTVSRRLNDKTYDIINSQNSQSDPLKVQIDTHFIQRQNGPPEMQTVTTFINPSVSPSKRQSDQSYNQRYNNLYNRGNSSPFNSSQPYQSKAYR